MSNNESEIRELSEMHDESDNENFIPVASPGSETDADVFWWWQSFEYLVTFHKQNSLEYIINSQNRSS